MSFRITLRRLHTLVVAGTGGTSECLVGLTRSVSTSSSVQHQSRSLFTLPSLFPGTSAIQRYQENRLVGYTQEQMYDIASNVSLYKEFVPWTQDSRVLAVRGNVLRAELVIGFGKFSEHFISRVDLQPCSCIRAHVERGSLMSHLTNTWKIYPGPTPKSCYLQFNVEFAFKSSLYAQVAHLFYKEVVLKMRQSFERRAYALYGAPSRPSTFVREVPISSVSSV